MTEQLGRALPPGVALRQATIDDVSEIAFMELALFPDDAWTVFMLAEEIEHPDRRYVVAETPSDLVGYAGIMLAGDTADVHTIGTTRPGEGIGSALLQWCESEARAGGATQLLLEVREDNTRARTFYERSGFTQVGIRRGYYRLPHGSVDALVMSKTLE